MSFSAQGFVHLPWSEQVAAWAQAARPVAQRAVRDAPRRHGGTWIVGVDALSNAPDGSISGVPLTGGWDDHVAPPAQWHAAQVSVVFAGYPGRDPDESAAAHRFRLRRDAAHVDGLLPEGPGRRRHLREPHAFILGLPLNDVPASPLVVWPGSHLIMARAFARAFAGLPPARWGDVDVTEAYQAARRDVFDTCPRVELCARPGEATLLHRHLLHGVAPWSGPDPGEGRMIAYFRPELTDPGDWLA